MGFGGMGRAMDFVDFNGMGRAMDFVGCGGIGRGMDFMDFVGFEGRGKPMEFVGFGGIGRLLIARTTVTETKSATTDPTTANAMRDFFMGASWSKWC